MDIFKTILSIVAFSVVVLVAYNLMKAYVFQKVKINKWLVLAVAIVVFIVSMLIWPNMPRYIANYVIPAVFVILFLWFMDLSGFLKNRSFSKTGSKTSSKTNVVRTSVKKDKKNDVVIRPKAKPNRVKNNQK